MARRTPRFTGSPAVPFARVARRLAVDGAAAPGSAARRAAARFPVRWTEHYLDRAVPGDPSDPIRRIAFPDPAELDAHAADLRDPVGESRRTPVPFVVRKHADRVVFLVASTCHVYCRFCFRRTFPQGGHRNPGPDQLDEAFAYLEREGDLREVILSGGDPLTLPDDDLAAIVRRLAGIGHLRSIRVHTRAPVHDPARVTPALADALVSGGLPVRVVTHFDHPRELVDEAGRAIDVLRSRGIPSLNQSVLLAGVNDDPAVLEDLCTRLWRGRVKPYYLHHPDRVPGAGAFWVAYRRGVEIYRELRRRLGGGPAVPSYVVDLPDGSGKVPVEPALADGRIVDPQVDAGPA